jgi:sulfane dehydrogenase subunit SoxC
VTRKLTRRELIAGAATAIGAAAVAKLDAQLPATQAQPAAQLPAAGAQGASIPPTAPPAATARMEGLPTSAVGARSTFVSPARTPTGATVGNSMTPLHELTGPITPSDLHFERHHAGIPGIDPADHRLMIHGLVDRPLVLTLDEIRRFPHVTRTHFIECSGNGRAAFRDPKPDMTAQRVAGMVSTSEWTGVAMATLLREAGVREGAKWFLAEGADACLMTRSVPMSKAWDDAIIAWAQNGEPLRPAQGYPMRLLLPGWEGNINVKWLRRIEVGTEPWMTRWETAKYTDPLPGNRARRFSFENDAKSIITSPSYPRVLEPRGWHALTGIAWSGRGRITRVEVSIDGGRAWSDAELTGQSLPKSAVGFQQMLNWQGEERIVLSRATDETGYVQPTRTQLIAARGIGTDYHFNPIVGWRIAGDGQVTFHGET